MKEFILDHFDAVITVGITIAGFIINYFATKKNFQDEIRKEKISRTAETIQSLPYDICQLMNNMIKHDDDGAEKYNEILSKVLTYGSSDAVKIAIKMQRMSYSLINQPPEDRLSAMAAYALLITQLKYDLTSEIISPESWFELRMTDYEKVKDKMKKWINAIIDELDLNENFYV